MNMVGKLSRLVIVICLLSGYCHAAPSIAEPKVARLCMRCHGPAGKSSQVSYPKLAGQSNRYLIKQLDDFKQGRQGPRYHPLMYTIAISLTNNDIYQLAEYFSQQPPAPGYAQNLNLDLGRRLYQGGDRNKGIPACKACHGPAGEGNAAANFPALAGQHAAYILRQLQAFDQRNRSNDPHEIMRDIAYSMNSIEKEAVANYINGLHQ